MKISRIYIENFRGIVKLEPELSIGRLNTFVGQNDSGKSIILKAMEAFFKEKIELQDVYKGKGPDEKTIIELGFCDIGANLSTLAVDIDGFIRVRKEFWFDKGKLKTNSYYCTNDFEDERYQDLWNKKEEDLNNILGDLKLESTKSGRGWKNLIKIEQINSFLKDAKRMKKYHIIENYYDNLKKAYAIDFPPEYSFFEAEEDLDTDSAQFQSQFKTLISDSFDSSKKLTDDLETKIKGNLSNELGEIRNIMANYISDLEELKPTLKCDWKKSVSFGIDMKFKNEKHDIPITHRGAGFRRIMMVSYFQYLTLKKNLKNKIFAIEEPETYLHPSAQDDLLESIKKLADETQFFITTHSPIFAGESKGANSILVKKEKGISYYQKAEKEDVIKSIIAELGIRPEHNLFDGKRFLIFVEGVDDRHFLCNAAKSLLGKEIEKDEILIILGGGSTLKNLAELDYFKKISGYRGYAVMIDGDNGSSQKTVQDKAAAVIEDRCKKDNAIFFRHSKRSIENYCHPACIKSIYKDIEGIDKLSIDIKDDIDVDSYLKSLNPKIAGFKGGKTIKIFETMSDKQWQEMDNGGAVKKFVNDIYGAMK